MNLTYLLVLNISFLLVLLAFLILFTSKNGNTKKHKEKNDLEKIKEHINAT